MIGIKTVGHGFAVAFKTIYDGAKAVESFVYKVASDKQDQAVLEAVTAATFGPAAANIERVGFALIGEFAQVLQKADAAAEQKLKDAGIDVAVIESVKQLMSDSKSQLAAVGVKL